MVDLGEFILKDVDLDVSDGEYFILLGPTGAGKTVLLEALAGLYPLMKGTISVGGRDHQACSGEARRKHRLSGPDALSPSLCGRHRLRAAGAKCPKPEIKQKIDDVAELLKITIYSREYQLPERRRGKGGTRSGFGHQTHGSSAGRAFERLGPSNERGYAAAVGRNTPAARCHHHPVTTILRKRWLRGWVAVMNEGR